MCKFCELHGNRLPRLFENHNPYGVGETLYTRWENVFASVYTCVIDESQWEFTLDYWENDAFYTQVTRVPKQDIEENPEWFGMLWEGMVARLDKAVKEDIIEDLKEEE